MPCPTDLLATKQTSGALGVLARKRVLTGDATPASGALAVAVMPTPCLGMPDLPGSGYLVALGGAFVSLLLGHFLLLFGLGLRADFFCYRLARFLRAALI